MRRDVRAVEARYNLTRVNSVTTKVQGAVSASSGTVPFLSLKKFGEKMDQETKRTVQIKLNTAPEQAEEIEKLFLAFKIGLNFCLAEIEKAYQKTAGVYVRIKDGEEKGDCAGCHKEKTLVYRSSDKMYCSSCVMRNYSEYTVRSSIIGTKDRKVEPDLKNAVSLENQTHFHMMFSQAYANWKSFDAWRKKREYERDNLTKELSGLENRKETRNVVAAAKLIWENAARYQRQNENITRRTAMALASKDVYNLFPGLLPRDISRIVNKIRRLNSLSRPVRFPWYDSVHAIQMHNSFVKFKDGKLHMSLFYKKKNQQVMDFYGNKYLNQFLSAYLFSWDEIPGTDSEILIEFLKRKFRIGWVETAKIEKIEDGNTIRVSTDENYLLLGINNEKTKVNLKIDDNRTVEFIAKAEGGKLNIYHSDIEDDNEVYTNLIKRIDDKKTSYYLMYPLTVKMDIPTIFDLADVFTICFSPGRVLVHGRYNEVNGNGSGESYKWYKLGWLIDKKTHGNEKRRELQDHNTRNSLRRIKKMGNAEQRATRTFNHQLSHNIIEYITVKSDNPLIVMWDISTGITADYGRVLNSVKRLWPVVQQQEFIKHKAFLRCVPVKMFPYKEENNLACSFCGKPVMKKDEMGKNTKESVKTITAILRGAKNLKCEKCGHELNLLLNQARNLAALPLTEKKDV